MTTPLSKVCRVARKRTRELFKRAEWIFEVKSDRFRTRPTSKPTSATSSRNGYEFKRFARLGSGIARLLAKNAILNGDLCCFGEDECCPSRHL